MWRVFSDPEYLTELLDLASKGTGLRAEFCRAKIPAYPSLQRAARALIHLHRYYSHFINL